MEDVVELAKTGLREHPEIPFLHYLEADFKMDNAMMARSRIPQSDIIDRIRRTLQASQT
jgi:hypothetical protein